MGLPRHAQVRRAAARLLAAILLLAAGSLVYATGPDVPLTGNTTMTRELVILVSSSASLNLGADARQGGGFAALVTYAKAERHRLTAESGGLVMAHVGPLSKAETAADFRDQLQPRGLRLLREAGFDAILPAPRERPWLTRWKHERTLVDFGQVGTTKSTVRPFRILERGKLDVFATALTLDQAGLSAQRVQQLRRLLVRNRAAHIQLILLSKDPAHTKSARRSFVARLLNLHNRRNPFRPLAADRWPRVRLISHPAHKNYVEKGVDGTLYCGARTGFNCRLSARFRGERLVGVNLSIVRPNGDKSPQRFWSPDPAVTAATAPGRHEMD